MGTDPKVSGRKGRLASPWGRGPNCSGRKAVLAREELLHHPRPAKALGCIDGNLDVLGLLIKQVIVHRAGDEFLVWVEPDGQVYAAWDNTASAKKVQAERPDWVVNNYRGRWEIHGERIYLKASAITEDLAYYREQMGVKA